MRLTRRNGAPVRETRNDIFDLTCDVCVVGLGTAGAIAAYAAARRNCSVIGIDRNPLPGGVGTAGCVWSYYYGTNGGLNETVNAECNRILETERYMTSIGANELRSYPTPVKGLALARALESARVRAFYRFTVTDVFCDNERICGIACTDGHETLTIRAKVVIDAAEGAVCRIADLPHLGGRRSDGKGARFSRTIGRLAGDHLLGAWATHGDYAGCSPEVAAWLTYDVATRYPCLTTRYTPNDRIYALGAEMGVREVPCVETEYVYTFEKYLAGERPSNPMFYAFAPLDNDNPDPWNENDDFIDWQILCDMHAHGISVGIPPEALIPKGTRGLLVAGKHIGTGHTMASAVRMRTDMEKCGEAAGTMAAEMVRRDCDALTLCSGEPFETLRGLLAETGCFRPDNNRGICDLNVPDGPMWKSCVLPSTAETLKPLLSSIHPALGLYAVRIGNIPNAADLLADWLEEGDRLLRENAAIALGLRGDRRCLPILREILAGPIEVHIYRSPDRYCFDWLCETPLCNFAKAIILAGRFADAEARPLLCRIADDPDSLKLIGADDNNYRIDAAASARASLVKIDTLRGDSASEM